MGHRKWNASMRQWQHSLTQSFVKPVTHAVPSKPLPMSLLSSLAWAVSQNPETSRNTQATFKCRYYALHRYAGTIFSRVRFLAQQHPPSTNGDKSPCHLWIFCVWVELLGCVPHTQKCFAVCRNYSTLWIYRLWAKAAWCASYKEAPCNVWKLLYSGVFLQFWDKLQGVPRTRSTLQWVKITLWL